MYASSKCKQSNYAADEREQCSERIPLLDCPSHCDAKEKGSCRRHEQDNADPVNATDFESEGHLRSSQSKELRHSNETQKANGYIQIEYPRVKVEETLNTIAIAQLQHMRL
jgi:hypothetical protein